MKKFFIALLACAVIGFSGCNLNRELKNMAIPDRVVHIEFWNGGGKIYEADNALVTLNRMSQSSAVGATEYWLTYTIETYNERVTIIDSESLSVLFY